MKVSGATTAPLLSASSSSLTPLSLHHHSKMKSFLKSLPSHRKKEKSRKARKSRDSKESGGGDQKIKIGCARFLDQTGELNLDYRRGEGGGIADFSPVKQSQCSESDMMSALTDEGSFVAGTQIQFPLRNSRNNIMQDKNDEEDGIDDMPENICPPQQSPLSAALPLNDIGRAPPEIHCPPMSQKLDDNNNNNSDETIDFGIDFQNGKVHENIAAETGPLDGSVGKKTESLDGSVKKNAISNIENAATLAVPKLHPNNNELSKVDPPNDEDRGDDHENRQGQENDSKITCQPKETMEQQHQDDEISVDETHMSLELLKRPDSNVVNTTIAESNKSATHVEPPSQMKPSQQQHSLPASKEPKSTEQHHINQHEQELTPSSHRSAGNAEFLLSSTDIRQCIDEVEEAMQMSEKDPSIFDVDIEKFHDFLQQFEKYVCALGDASSVEAEELQQIQNEEDQVFVIFDRGMSIDHCNVMFIRDVICTISSGIDDQKRSNPSQASQNSSGQNQRKLDQLANGLDFVFGISGGVESSTSQSKVGVTISNSPGDNGTKLWFTKRQPSNDESNPRNQQPSSIPSHLNEISEIFARFAAKEARTLQSQLDTTRLALSKLRSHAMTLQAQALKATDHALHADNETKFVREQFEVELCNRQSEYEMQKKSFERAKEGYRADLERKQMELDQVKARYENELKEARDELLRLKATRTGQLDKRGVQYDKEEEDTTNGKINSKNRQYGSSFTRDNTNNAEGSVRDNHYSSRSHPRNIDYKSSNPVDDTDAKRRRSKDSDSSFANGGSTHRTALKSYSVNNFTDQSSSNTNLTRGGKASPTKSKAVVNPYKKQIRAKTKEDGKPTFAYQEVVRKRDERMDLPGHDCEECRKFLDALEAAGGHIDRDEIINQCSRHRSRHKPGKFHLDDWFSQVGMNFMHYILSHTTTT